MQPFRAQNRACSSKNTLSSPLHVLDMELTEEQRKRAEANRLAALAKRKAFLESSSQLQPDQHKQNPWLLFKCRKLSHELNPRPLNIANKQPSIDSVEPIPTKSLVEKFRVRLEICSPDAFSAMPLALRGFPYPGEERCLQKLSDCLSSVSVFGLWMLRKW